MLLQRQSVSSALGLKKNKEVFDDMKTPVIDIHAHPWLFEEVCTTEEQEAFVIDMTGLYKSGSFPAEEHFIQMDYNLSLIHI